jgi:hypothetical protein
MPAYLESNLRWVLASEDHEPGRVLFIDSSVVRKYLAGGIIQKNSITFKKRYSERVPGLAKSS